MSHNIGMGPHPNNPTILTPDHLVAAEKEGNLRLVETADGFAQVIHKRISNLTPFLSFVDSR